MTPEELESTAPFVHALTEVEMHSENLKTKLPWAINQIKQNIPVDQTQKKLLSAAKSLLSKSASTFKTVRVGLNIPGKEMDAMSMAQFKVAFAKAIKSSRSESDWGVKFFDAYQKMKKTGWAPTSDELMLIVCSDYTKMLIGAVSKAQIGYAILK